MRKSLKIKGIIAVLLFQCILQCSGGGDEVITGITPASAVGYLYCYDGKAADRADIKAVPVDNLPNSFPTNYPSHTDSKGRFEFSIPSGDYNIYCTQDSLRALLRVKIQGTISLPNDTLKLPGRIDGVVRLAGGEDCRTVLIMIRGYDANLISVPIDTSGAFTLDSLAEGNYQVRFLSIYRSYPVIDTSFNVLSGKSTDAGTIIMKGNL
jgi:hypothetical protein